MSFLNFLKIFYQIPLLWVIGLFAPDQIERPENRPLTICSMGVPLPFSTCPLGYNWRDVTIGEDCPFFIIGKCTDNSRFVGEGCDFVGAECKGSLRC